jgi:hypothetical protein
MAGTGCTQRPREVEQAGQSLQTPSSLPNSQLLAEGDLLATYADPADSSRKLVVSRPRAAEAGSVEGWRVERRVERAGKPVREQGAVQSFRRLADGTVALVSTDEFADGVRTEFDPPMPALPAEIASGEDRATTAAFGMVVRPLANLSRVQTSGEATIRIWLADRQVRTLPGGQRVDAILIRSVLSAKLGSAQVTSTTDMWYGVVSSAPGGSRVLIEEHRTEKVTVFGLPFRSAEQRWLLAELGGGKLVEAVSPGPAR